MGRTDLPTGTVTFLFSDIEGSTRLLGQLGDRYPALLEEHQRILREAYASAGGIEVTTEGDSFFVVFRSAPQAIAAAVEAQRTLASHEWPADGRVRVRIGIHTGEGQLGADNYVGIDLHRAARITAAGHGGQILVSASTCSLTQPSAPEGVSFRDLGEHRLKDLEAPERVYQVVADGLESEFPPIRSLDARPGNLPPQLTSFIGRRREVEEIKEALARTRMLTLTGPGGTGKTRLSLQVAAEVQDRFEDGAFFVALSPITDPALVAPTIAHALGLREDPARPSIETVIEHLRDRSVLLVLDNFEQVLEAGHKVGEILAATQGVTVLATSREMLNLHGEQEYPVPPLGLPDPAHLPSLEALSQYEAVALFIERAAAVRPGFAVTNENAPAVAEICARLDGLPLAIELAAARVKLLSPDAILKRLEHRLTLLAGGARDLPTRQQTLRDAIAWSYDLLDEEEQRLFAELSVFVGGFTLEAVDALRSPEIAVDALDGVASLANKSLLRQAEGTQGEPRFFMLETIREFAMERLAERPDATEVRIRHARYFLEMTQRSADELFGAKQAEILDALSHEHDNLRAAIANATEHGELDIALRLAGRLWRFWQMRGHLREASERLRALVEDPAAERHPEALATALEGAGGVAYWMADWDTAERCYQRCLELRRPLEDRRALAEALYNLSFVYTVPPPPRQDAVKGARLLEEAYEIYQEADDPRGAAKLAWARTNLHTIMGSWEEARPLASEAVALFRELDDRFGLGWSLHGMGLVASFAGEFAEARAALSESLELFREAGDVTGVALVLNDFAFLLGSEGQHEEASRLRGAARAFEHRSGQRLVTNFEDLYPTWAPTIRGTLSEEEYARLVAEGEAMSEDEAIDLALRLPPAG